MNRQQDNKPLQRKWLPGLVYILAVIALIILYYGVVIVIIFSGNEQGINDVTPYFAVVFTLVFAVPFAYKKVLLHNHFLAVQVFVVIAMISSLGVALLSFLDFLEEILTKK